MPVPWYASEGQRATLSSLFFPSPSQGLQGRNSAWQAVVNASPSESCGLLLFSFFETGFHAGARGGLKLIFWPLPLECLIIGMFHQAHLRECDLQTNKQKNRMYL